MTTWKRIALIAGALLLLFVLVLAAAPLLFKDRIESRVKTAINDRVDASVDFGDVGASFFRSFPNLSFSLDDLAVTGVDAFEGDTLAHVGRFRLVVDLGSAIRMLRRGEPLVVRSVIVDRPYLHARVLEDGRASWDVMKAAREVDPAVGGEPAGGAAIDVALRRLAVHDGRVALDDAATDTRARIEGLEHTLAGDFAADRFTLRTRTTADRVSVAYAGIPYLSGARIEAAADMDADFTDPDARQLTVRENRVALNELGLGVTGTVMLRGDVADLDLAFAADRADFRDILSLIPAIYTQDFASLDTRGTVAVDGLIRGPLALNGAAAGGEGAAAPGGSGQSDAADAAEAAEAPASGALDAVPSFALNVDVANGLFHYPDLPLPVQSVFVDLSVTNPGGSLDSTRVDLRRFNFAVGDEPFRATLALATPISDPELRASLDGRIDLEALNSAMKLEGIDELRGTITSDAEVHARRSWLEAEQYDRVEATGRVELRGVAVSGEKLRHDVAVDELRLVLAPAYADMPAFSARAGSSDFSGSGRLDNLLGFVLRGEELRGRATLASRYIDLDEWRSEEESELQVIPVPANLDMALTATVDSMTFGELSMTAAHGDLRVKDERVTLDEFALSTLGGAIVTSGWYDTSDLERPAFDFHLAMADLDIPGAFAAFNTVRALAPAAQYARGEFSADMDMGGILGPDMVPVFDELDGLGTISTREISVQGLPALHRLADAVKVDRLRDPALSDFASTVEITDGRLHVRPFDLQLGPGTATVAGSNGIDQSLDYRVALRLPRAELGTEANQAIAGLVDRAGQAGIQLEQAEAVRLDAVIGGTMTDPTVRVDFGDAIAAAGASLREQAEARIREEAGAAIDSARLRAEAARARAEDEARARAAAAQAEALARADSAEAEARQRARARADSVLADAETQAQRIRDEAARAATNIRREADEQAERLVAEATNPIARRAAQAAADKLRAEAEERATQLETEADRRADQVMTEARARADSIVGDAGGG